MGKSVFDSNTVKFNSDGLVPVIVQDGDQLGEQGQGRVLMMAWMNEDALRKTFETKEMHYWSRSRKKLWRKGETSGNTQKVLNAFVDCDGDTLLFFVKQIGEAACHTGYQSCFYQEISSKGELLEPREKKVFDPKSVYES